MPGFIFIKGSLKNDFLDYKNEKLLVENLEYADVKIQRRTIKKFLDDKIFYQDKNYLIVTEGVIFNKFKLIKKYKKENFKDAIIEMYKKNGDTFFNEFRGSFSGILIDKEENRNIIYGDQIGSKLLFYYKFEKGIIIASEIKWILEILKMNNLDYSLDKVGTYSLLTFGFMLSDFTLFSEIKKIFPGNYLELKGNSLTNKVFHRFTRKEMAEYNKKECVEKLDFLFKKATKYQVDKNKEYGYLDLAPLSAGYDTRMMNLQLKEMGAKEIYNLTYSETDNNDEIIPKILARNWGNHFLFKALDNGKSLFYLDEAVERNMGMVYYAGGAQVYDSFHLLNFDKFGIVHTGMLGDGYPEYPGKYIFGNWVTSKTLLEKLKKLIPNNIYDEDGEIFTTYTRGFNGMNMGQPLLLQEYTESYTPFQDIDWLEYYLTIPQEKRRNRYIQNIWMKEKFPIEASIPINGIKINEFKFNIFGKQKTLNQILNFLKNKVINFRRKGMNPLNYWYENNIELRKFINNYYEDNIFRLNNYPEIKEDAKKLFMSEKIIEKIQVLSLLSALKLYFGEKSEK